MSLYLCLMHDSLFCMLDENSWWIHQKPGALQRCWIMNIWGRRRAYIRIHGFVCVNLCNGKEGKGRVKRKLNDSWVSVIVWWFAREILVAELTENCRGRQIAFRFPFWFQLLSLQPSSRIKEFYSFPIQWISNAVKF